MSGRIAKSQIPFRSQASLPADVKFALVEAKNLIQAGFTVDGVFGNTRGRTDLEGPPLPAPSQGCKYYEKYVGQDRKGKAGSKRLLFEVNTSSRQIMEIYYSGEHYAKGTVVRIV